MRFVTLSGLFASAVFANAWPLPPETSEEPRSGLLVSVLRYDGASHGHLLVEIENASSSAATFSSVGLYFIPERASDVAVQRLAALDGFQLESKRKKISPHRLTSMSLGAGQKVRVYVFVYSLDPQRHLSGSKTPYRVATSRLPISLMNALADGVERETQRQAGLDRDSVDSMVQRRVNDIRRANWVTLEGEGPLEAAFQAGQPTPIDSVDDMQWR
jgi:hypothetical protein